MPIFFFLPDFCVFWNGASFSKKGGVWLLLVMPLLFRSDSTTHSFSLTHSCLLSDRLRDRVYNWWFTPISSNPTGLMTTLYCLRFKTAPAWRARSLYLYPPRTGWPKYIPRHWVPFSSTLMTHRAMVEVFNPAFMWDWTNIQCHRLRLDATQYILYYLPSLFLPPYMFRPYLAILRCRSLS
jgi:hypothetical protein